MERYSFFNAVMDATGNYDREYLAEDFAAYFASFIGNGVYASPSANLKVTNAGGMDVRVFIGKAWINGYFYENTASKIFSLDILNQTAEYSRIDSVVLRLNLLDRVIETDVKKGTSAKNPSAPTLERNENIFELRLADIKVVGGRTEIKSQDITDCRFGSDCGVVSGVVNQIDTEGLFSQYDAEFRTWFADVEATLSGDVAGNLYNQIAVERSRIDNIASLKDGSTTADAELKDIRVGADGTIYTSAGNAVREQFKKMNDSISSIESMTGTKLFNIQQNDENILKNGCFFSNTDDLKGKRFGVDVTAQGGVDGYNIYKRNMKKGDSIIFIDDVFLYPSSGCPYLFVTDFEGNILDYISLVALQNNGGSYVFPIDEGTVYFDFNARNIAQYATTYFYVKEAGTIQPLILKEENADSYLENTFTGDETLKAILNGRQILVRVPNASGDDYVATYSPIYMYQLPNYKNEYLYLFYLKDEKQNIDLSMLGMGVIQMPIYGELKMKLSQEYNNTPLG